MFEKQLVEKLIILNCQGEQAGGAEHGGARDERGGRVRSSRGAQREQQAALYLYL